jgi:2,3-bisphosphoglycerate-dependent phosphoglycerate mutase/probable phosphoglycerate mutase
MLTLYLVRHGQKKIHPGDPGLTEIGVNQAIQTGRYLNQFSISKIISSPFKRAVQTAKHIGKELNLNYDLDENLVERMNWKDGDVTKSEFLNEWVKSTNDRSYLPKYGDSSINTGLRIEELVKNLDPINSHVLLVTHGGAILDYLRNVFGDKKISRLRKKYTEGNDFVMLNCSINRVIISENPVLELLNYSDHLEEKTE